MKSVLIIEKQNAMINFYKKFVPWEKYGYVVTSTTDNITMATAYFSEYLHDLVICGTKLIDGDGLNLIKGLKKIKSETEFIVISDDYSYEKVRYAFKIGVADYFIRTKVTVNDICETLKEINYKKENNIVIDGFRNRAKNILGNLRDGQITSDSLEPLYQIFDSDEFSFMKEDHRLVLLRVDNVMIYNRGYPTVNGIEIDQFGDEKYINKVEDRKKRMIRIKEQLRILCEKYKQFNYLFVKHHVVLLCMSEKDYNNFYNELHDIKSAIEKIIEQEISFFCSKEIYGYENFSTDFREVYDSINSKFYVGDSIIIDENNINIKFEKMNLLPDYNPSIYVKLTRKNEIQEMAKRYNNFINTCKDENINPKEVIQLSIKIAESLLDLLKSSNLEDDKIFKKFYRYFKESETYLMLEYVMFRYFKCIEILVKMDKINKSKIYSKKICEYINNNIEEKINVSKISTQLDLSPTHTSRVFKEEMNIDLSVYIQKVKMEIAASYLKNKDLRIKEIAQKLGYTDQLYFNRVFKKFYQKSPKQYRTENSTR